MPLGSCQVKYWPMVVHLKDQAHSTLLDLLKVLIENEENDSMAWMCYLPATSLLRTSTSPKTTNRYQQTQPGDKWDCHADCKNDGLCNCKDPAG